MKRKLLGFTKSILLVLLLFAALPDKAMAWSSLNLRSSLNSGNWTGTNDDLFTKNGDDNKWKKEIDVSSLNADIYFRIYVSDDGGKQIFPKSNGTEISVGSSTSDLNFEINNTTNNSWKIANPSSAYSKITIYAEYNNGWTIRVEGTAKGGGSESNFKLMSGTNNGSAGNSVATFTGTNFPYTVTYDINSTGTYYFYVNDGTQDYLNNNQAFADGTDVQVYPYGSSNYQHMIKLDAQTTGTYTFTFNQSDSKYYLKCDYPSTSSTTYYLVGDENYFGGWNTTSGKAFGSNGEVSVDIKSTSSSAAQFKIFLKSATTRLYDTEAKIICIVSKKGAQCIECHHKDI